MNLVVIMLGNRINSSHLYPGYIGWYAAQSAVAFQGTLAGLFT